MLETVGFDEPVTELSKEHLGGKACGLAHMADIGINVPPAVIIPTQMCNRFLAGEPGILDAICYEFWVNQLPKFVTKFGYVPLFSVRSGARVSMPGMMDTILNVGLTTDNYSEWQDRLGTDCVLDCRSRLKTMYQDVVGEHLPDDLAQQLTGCVRAVFESWMNERAVEYRGMYGYSDEWGTAVIIQSMVFGNMSEQSCSGVAFTRDPATGARECMGEFLPNAQGEDVVAGTHTPLSLEHMSEWNPPVLTELCAVMETLESHCGDMQDIEFTVQDGDLFILQTREGKRLPKAAFQIALDMVEDGIWDLDYAVSKLSTAEYLQLSTTEILDDLKPDGTGIAAGGTIVVGKAVFTAEAAVALKEDCILIRHETDPNDVLGMAAAVGILTSTGGKTSHAAVVSRGFGKTCVCGLADMVINHPDGAASLNGAHITEGACVAIDGETGKVWFNEVPTVEVSKNGHIGHKLMRLILESKGLVQVGEIDDLIPGQPMAVKTSGVRDLPATLNSLLMHCMYHGIAASEVTIDLRDEITPNDADMALFNLTTLTDLANEEGRVACAIEFEKNATGPFGTGLNYLTSVPSDLPGVTSVTTLGDLMRPGIVTVPTSFGTLEEVRHILHGLDLAGHKTPLLFGGVSRLDEVAFNVLD